MAIRKAGKYFQIDYYDPSGKRIRKNFKKKKNAVAEEAKRKALMAEGRYLDVTKEFDTTLGEAIELYEKNFSRQASWRVKSGFIDIIKEHFGSDKKLCRIRYRDLETFRSYLRSRITYIGSRTKELFRPMRPSISRCHVYGIS